MENIKDEYKDNQIKNIISLGSRKYFLNEKELEDVDETFYELESSDILNIPLNCITHYVSDLLKILINIESTHGNLSIIYWNGPFYIKMCEDDIFDVINIGNYKFLTFGGFIVNGKDCFDMAETNELFEPLQYTTHKIMDLIYLLNDIKWREGNLPIVYWDETSYIKMQIEYLTEIINYKDEIFLSFGGWC